MSLVEEQGAKRELVQAYLRRQVSRRLFVERLVDLGVSVAAANAYPRAFFTTSADAIDVKRDEDGFFVSVDEGLGPAGWIPPDGANKDAVQEALSPRESPPRTPVVCLLPARNAAQDLPGYFESAARFCDAIVALDDGSTDGTRELLEACPLVKILLTNPHRGDYRGWDDAGNRNRLLAAAAALDPAWIISLDADERVDPGDAAALRGFLRRDALPGCAYGFRIFPMQEDRKHYEPPRLWVYRLFAYEPGQAFPHERLHFVPVPMSIPRAAWLDTTLRIQHLAGMTAARRRARFEKYRQADPENEYQPSYAHLLREPSELLRWKPRPPDLPVLRVAAEVAGNSSSAETTGDPELSAIVISRDDEARIARTVASVVGQDCSEPFEVIVVVSGTDRTAEIVREEFPEVTLIELPRPALPGEARNAGLRLARGAYVSFPGSHVELPEGSLEARLRAHQLGYAMVTGVVLNGTLTRSGWASYFLDHHANLPEYPPLVLGWPPASCSYARAPLLEVGGFPEDLRAGEDTVANTALFNRGYVAYRDPHIRFTHHSPCRTPWRLARHHFTRGRGLGRIILGNTVAGHRLLNRHFLKGNLLKYLPRRLKYTSRNVLGWGDPEHRRRYVRVFPLIVVGAFAAWSGLWFELLRPAPGKLRILLGRTLRHANGKEDGRVAPGDPDPGRIKQPAAGPGQLDARYLGWYPASPENYVEADRPGSTPIDKIVIHVTQGSWSGTIDWFQDPASKVSSHYTVRSSDGFVARSVREKDIARHTGNWSYNQTSIGIEHEGFVEDPTSLSDAMYRSSARLAARLARRYGIPVDRRHIIGHDEVPNPNEPGRYGGRNEHQDPGPHFDWDRYIGYVRSYLR